MRKTSVLIIIVCVLVAIAAAGFLVSELAFGGAAFNFPHRNISRGSANGGGETAYLDKSFPGGEINKVDLYVNIADVTLVYSDGGEFRVEQYGSDDLHEDYLVTASQNGGILSVKTNSGVNRNLGNAINQESHIIISAPRDFNGDMSLNVSVGGLYINESFSLSSLDAIISLGDLTASDSLAADKIKLSVSAGSIKIDSLESGGVDIGCSLGEIDIDELRGSGKISNSTGSINLPSTELTGDLKVTNSLGEGRIGLVSGQSFDFSGKTSLGEVKTYFAGSSSKIDTSVNGGGHKLTVTNSTGEIRITED